MAYDAANGTVVLFGGQGRSTSLDDTWTWDGSVWSQAHPTTSPPALDEAQMAYDPVSHDIVLVGGRQSSVSNSGPIACPAVSGSSGYSGSTGSSGSKTSLPAILPACATIASPAAVTWLWNGSDWSKASGPTPDAVFGNGTLATDPVSGRAVLLARGPFAEPAVAEPGFACPLLSPTSAKNSNGEPECPLLPIATPSWTWDGHAWQQLPESASTPVDGLIGSAIIVDAVSGKLATFSGDFYAPIPTPLPCAGCIVGAPVPAQQSACCTGTESVWSGTSWHQVATFKNGPQTSGVTFVGDPATHSDVVLNGSGQTWVWTGTWKQVHPATTPPIVSSSASAYDAASGQVIVFGGYGATSHSAGLYDQTWTWDGTDWTQRGGASGPSVTIPVPIPVSVPPGLPCEPVVGPDLPVSSPIAQPQPICNGSSGAGSGGTGSATGVSAGSGVAAP